LVLVSGCLGVEVAVLVVGEDERGRALVGWLWKGSEFYSEMKVASMNSWPFSVLSSTFTVRSSLDMY